MNEYIKMSLCPQGEAHLPFHLAPQAATVAPKLPHQRLPGGGSHTLARGRATPELSLLLIFPNWVESQAKQLQGDDARDHSQDPKAHRLMLIAQQLPF